MISSRKMLICVLLIVMVVLPLQLFATDGAKSGIVMNPSSGASRGEKLILDDGEIVDAEPIDPQVQLDTIQRALLRLPAPELDRLGVDLTKRIEKGSIEAEELFSAWKRRQDELKEAMASMMKPAEHMANLTQQLRSNNITNAQRRQILIDLESLLADIDNARDFHTIGSWPTLISQLVRPDRGMEAEEISIQSAAAWAIGTAVKNSYDYQLWLLEDVSFSHPSMGKIQITQKARAWDLLQSLLEEYSILSDEQLNREEYVELQKRLLYAISAGVRGNVEIQAECEPLISILSRMTSHRPTSIEVTRKIMTLIQDIVEERQYIALELLPKLSHVSSDMPRKIRLEAEMSTENASSTSSDSSADMLTVEIDGNKITAEQARLAVDSLQSTLVLGEYFFQEKWLQTIVDTANRSIDELLRISSAIEESGKLSSRINYQATLSSCVHILTSIVKQAPSVTRSFHPSLQAIITRMSSSLHEDIFADAGIDHAAILSML